jgi:hypothetical protein
MLNSATDLVRVAVHEFLKGSSNMRQISILAVCACALASLGGCGASPEDKSETASATEAVTGSPVFSGKLTVSTTATTVGSPIIVEESASNLTGSQVGPIILGIRRLGFTVAAVQKPATGICRVAGSATCNFIELAAHDTQSYRLTLTANAPGTYTIQGWATSSYVAGGASGSVTVTVR